MECARCRYANAEGSRFCGECGVSLIREATCAGCGHANPADQKFCNGCGNRLGESALAPDRDLRAYTLKLRQALDLYHAIGTTRHAERLARKLGA